jgi:hypothetical protein
LQAGAEDVGFVELERTALAEERPHIERAFPRTRSLISFLVRMNRDDVRSPARSIANTEFHHAGDEINSVARRITAALEREGIRGVESADGVSDGGRPVDDGAAVGVVAQTGRGRGRIGSHGNSSQRHPSAFREFHFTRHDSGGGGD